LPWQGGNLQLLEHLQSAGCVLTIDARNAAAELGDVTMLKFLRRGLTRCDRDLISIYGAYSGNIDMMKYLKEGRIEFHAATMETAAQRGDMEMVKYLHDTGCQWDERVSNGAAEYNQLAAVEWLDVIGCPFNFHEATEIAAYYGYLDMVIYLVTHREVMAADQWTELLNIAGAREHLDVAKWLKSKGTEWPTVLKYDGYEWFGTILQWARGEGCNAPTKLNNDDDVKNGCFQRMWAKAREKDVSCRPIIPKR
jgi:hypothetical protein